MKPMKQSISITLDENVLADVKQLAEESDRSVSSVINLVLKKYLGNRTNLPE